MSLLAEIQRLGLRVDRNTGKMSMTVNALMEIARPSHSVPLRCTVALALTVALVILSACGTGDRRDEQSGGDLDKYFLRDVAAAEAAGITVYWLGRQFEAGALVFYGPYGSGVGAEVEGGGISADYFAPVEPNAELFAGLDTTLEITTYSQDAWDLVKERMMDPSLPGVTRNTVSVQDRDGQLISQSAGTRPLNALWLVLDLSHVVVMASVNSGGPVYPGGPDYSPFINNPDLLVEVIDENLRPYPE